METNHVVKQFSEFNGRNWQAFETKLKEKTELYNDVIFSIDEDFKHMYKCISEVNGCWSINNIVYKMNDEEDLKYEPDKSKVIIDGIKYISNWIPEQIRINKNGTLFEEDNMYIIGIYDINCVNNKELTVDTPFTHVLSINGFIAHDNKDNWDIFTFEFTCDDYHIFCKKLKTIEYTDMYSQQIIDKLQQYVHDIYVELYKTYDNFIHKIYTIFMAYIDVRTLHGEDFREHMIKYNWNIEFDNYGNVIRKL